MRKLSIKHIFGVNQLILLSIILNPLIYKLSPLGFFINVIAQLILIIFFNEDTDTKIWKLYILSFSYFGLEIIGLKIYDFIMVISFVVLLLKKRRLKVRMIDLIIAITFISFIMFTWSYNGYESNGLVEITRYILAFLVFFLFFNTKPNIKAIISFIPIIALSNIIQSIILYQFILMNEISNFQSAFINITLFMNTSEVRLNAFFTDPNKFMCFFFFLFVVYEIYYYINKKEIKAQHRWITHLILVIGILISFSRTGLIAIAIYIVLLLFRKIFKNSKIIYFFIYSLSVLIIILLLSEDNIIFELINYILVNSAEVLGRERTAEINAVITEDNRYLIWKVTFDYILSNPLVGYGPLSFLAILPYPPHNTYLTVMLDFGLIGLILFVSFMAPIIKNIKTEILFPFIIIPTLMLDLSNFRLLFIILAIVISKNQEQTKYIR